MIQYVISPEGPPGKNSNNLFVEKTSWNEVSSVENNTKTSWYTIKSMRKFFLFRIFVRNFSYLQKSIRNFSYKNRKKKHWCIYLRNILFLRQRNGIFLELICWSHSLIFTFLKNLKKFHLCHEKVTFWSFIYFSSKIAWIEFYL